MVLKWEQVESVQKQLRDGRQYGATVFRAKVPGGWFVRVEGGGSGTTSGFFYPDPEHTWDGSSLP